MMMPLKLLGLGTVLLAAVSADSASHAQDWPSRPVKVVVPFAAAGTTDRLGRIAAEELSKTFKQQFYVENRVGGGGVVGAVQVARDPDGYLMIGGYGPHIFAPAARRISATTRCRLHPYRDDRRRLHLVAHPALGVRSFADR
jgi:tripartite-type tricarboxylate transporter receptor subunit TctC